MPGAAFTRDGVVGRALPLPNSGLCGVSIHVLVTATPISFTAYMSMAKFFALAKKTEKQQRCSGFGA